MPTSEAGSESRCQRIRRPHQKAGTCFARPHGFTLIELLVVLAIVAAAAATVSLSLRDGTHTALEREAERLAALFESARAQSRATGSAVQWRVTHEGFAFDGVPRDALPGTWLHAGVHAQAADGQGTPIDGLRLGPDPIIAAQQVRITMEGAEGPGLLIATDGLRPFAVHSP